MFSFQLKNLNYVILDLYVIVLFHLMEVCKQKRGKNITFRYLLSSL